MRRDVFAGLNNLSVVRTIAVDGIERLDVYFGVVGDSVVILNSTVLDWSGVRIDTTAWNYFVRSRLDLQLGPDGGLAVFTCVLDHVADGWPDQTGCARPEPIDLSTDGAIFTISARSRSHDPSRIYRVRADGALAEIPRFHPVLDTQPR